MSKGKRDKAVYIGAYLFTHLMLETEEADSEKQRKERALFAAQTMAELTEMLADACGCEPFSLTMEIYQVAMADRFGFLQPGESLQ